MKQKNKGNLKKNVPGIEISLDHLLQSKYSNIRNAINENNSNQPAQNCDESILNNE
jgi:hypothetical protein